jgi:hypothetical protein
MAPKASNTRDQHVGMDTGCGATIFVSVKSSTSRQSCHKRRILRGYDVFTYGGF